MIILAGKADVGSVLVKNSKGKDTIKSITCDAVDTYLSGIFVHANYNAFPKEREGTGINPTKIGIYDTTGFRLIGQIYSSMGNNQREDYRRGIMTYVAQRFSSRSEEWNNRLRKELTAILDNESRKLPASLQLDVIRQAYVALSRN